MRAIAPRTGHPERIYAEHQLEYLPVTVAIVEHEGGKRALLTRWTLTPEERQRVFDGVDIYVAQLNFGNPMTPMMVHCGPGPYAWCTCTTPVPNNGLCSTCG